MPAITTAVDLDGTSAPGYSAAPVVEIDFNHFDGLTFGPTSTGAALQGLSLVNADNAGVTLNGGGNTTLTGNYIGLALDGSTVVANAGDGVDINNASGNTIGGLTAADRNVISGNGGNGIDLSNASNNLIDGNYIGADATGLVALGNAASGVLVTGGGSGNTIGGARAT